MGQEVIQIKPKATWNIPCVPRMENKKNVAIACLEIIVFLMKICDYFE